MGVKISELTSAGTLAGTEKIPCVDSGTQYTTPADMKRYMSGLAVQTIYTADSAAASGSTTTPYDNTIPQNTEGNQFLSATITPTNASNIIEIEAELMLCENSNTGDVVTVALFQDSTADALKAVSGTKEQGLFADMVRIFHRMTAGTTSATTFKIRAGMDIGQINFNSSAGGATRLYGGVAGSYIKITEIQA